MSSDKTTLKKEVENSLKTTPYPQTKLKGLGLQFSMIPQQEATRVLFYLDQGSHLELAAKALKDRLTADELIRRLIWTYLSL